MSGYGRGGRDKIAFHNWRTFPFEKSGLIVVYLVGNATPWSLFLTLFFLHSHLFFTQGPGMQHEEELTIREYLEIYRLLFLNILNSDSPVFFSVGPFTQYKKGNLRNLRRHRSIFLAMCWKYSLHYKGMLFWNARLFSRRTKPNSAWENDKTYFSGKNMIQYGRADDIIITCHIPRTGTSFFIAQVSQYLSDDLVLDHRVW